MSQIIREKFHNVFVHYCKHADGAGLQEHLVVCNHPDHERGCQHKSCPFIAQLEKFLQLSRLENFLR
jgi:hypothetical protein